MRAAVVTVLLSVAAGCFSEGADGSASTGSASGATNPTTGDVCADGELGCACYGNGTCNDGLECAPEALVCILEDCDFGTRGCTCADGACVAGLECIQQLCREPPPPMTTGADSSGGTPTGGDSAETSAGTSGDVTRLYLFASKNTFTPGSSPLMAPVARGPLDDVCADDVVSATLPCRESVAVISLANGDAVVDLEAMRGMPFDVPVVSLDEVQIASSFGNALQAGQIDVSLEASGSVPSGPSSSYWTASDEHGAFATDCNGWDGAGVTGHAGLAANTDALWLADATSQCDQARRLLCACW